VDPEVVLHLQDDMTIADVHNGTQSNPCKVKLAGWVSVNFDPSTTVVVQLSVSNSWRTAAIAPTAVQFSVDTPGNKEFNVEMVIPYQVRSDDECEVVVYGSWIMYPGEISGSCESVNGFVLIEKYHKFRVRCFGSKGIEVNPGDDVTPRLNIQNWGNGEETFIINIKNLDELNDKGFEIDMAENPVRVLPKDQATFGVLVKTPSDSSRVGRHTIEFEIKPMDENNTDVPVELITYYIDLKPYDVMGTPYGICLSVILVLIIIPIIIFIIRYRRIRLWKKLMK
jgi:hypothetical protein